VSKALFLARHDLRHALRQRETLVWVFAMPAVFFYFIGTVTGGDRARGGGAERERIELAAGPDAGYLADELALGLAASGLDVARVALDAPAEETARLELPERLTERVLAGERLTVVLHPGEDGLTGDYVQFRAARAVYGLVASLAALGADGSDPGPDTLARLRQEPRALAVDERSAGKRERIPTGYEQTIPGTLVMFTMIVLLTSGAIGIVIERRSGLLRRLASAPIRRGEVVLGKWLGLLALGLVQIGFGMLLGTLAFGMRWGPDVPAVLVLLLAWGGFSASLAILLGSLARSEGQAIAIGVIAANVLAALGGCWWPIEVTPPWMQALARFLPTGWAMDAMHQVAIFENGAASGMPQTAALAAAALVVGALAARCFRFQ
jgi:ABC-type Na+ efflux pump permease subunit